MSYTQSYAVQFMHKLPRFGHGSDFAKLASNNEDEQIDYALGIIAISFFVLCFFIFWGSIIIAWKCMGYERVGICAGRARVTSNNKGKFRAPPYLWFLRCIFMGLGCSMILLCMELVGPGLQSVETTSVSIRKLNRDVKDLATQGLLIMDSVKRVRWTLDEVDVVSVLNVTDACPKRKNNAFITDKTMRKSIQGLYRDFYSLRGYLEQSSFDRERAHIANIMDGTESIDTAVTVVEKNDWIVRMFATVLNVLVLFMIFASCAALCGKCCCLPALSFMTESIILPLFVILIVASWFATSVFAFMSISNADFCSGNSQEIGPAGTVLDIFEERGITDKDILFNAFAHYQSGCTTEDPIKYLYEYEDSLQSGIGSANKFLMEADEIGIEELNDKCGRSVRPIIEGIGLIKDNLGILLGALRSTFELASCINMEPKYKHAFEGTACTDSSGTLTILFSVMFGINVIGMMMIMLRSALYPYRKVYPTPSNDEQDEWEEYQAYLQYMSSFVNMWGGNAADEEAVASKTGTYETASSTASIESRHNTNNSIVSNNEEIPLSPLTPALDSTYYEDREEQMPLSPETYSTGINIQSPEQSMILCTPQTNKHSDSGWDEENFVQVGRVIRSHEETQSPSPMRRRPQNRVEKKIFTSPVKKNRHSAFSLPWSSANKSIPNVGNEDEFQPLSPDTVDIITNEQRSATCFSTPNFLNSALPKTPLMNSPRDGYHGGGSYFSSMISPASKRRGTDRLHEA